MIEYGIEVRIRTRIFRFGTSRIVLSTQDSCGETYLATFDGGLISLDPASSSLSFDQAPSIPVVRASVWDLDREMVQAFEDTDYGEAVVTIFRIYEGEEQARVQGYIASLNSDHNKVDLAIRLDEDRAASDILKKFSYDSFQTLEIPSVLSVEMMEGFTVKEDTPWRAWKYERKSARLGDQDRFRIVSGEGFVLSPSGAVIPDSKYIKLDFDGLNDDSSNDFEQYRLAVSSVDLPDNTTDSRTVLERITSSSFFTIGTNQKSSNGSLVRTYDYFTAVIGNPETSKTTVLSGDIVASSTSQERIRYSFCLKNEVFIGWDDSDPQFPVPLFSDAFSYTPEGDVIDYYYLSGIPTTSDLNPTRKDNFDENDNLPYTIQNYHLQNEVVREENQKDRLWIKADGLIPNSRDDIKLSRGFVWAGRGVLNPLREEEFKAFSSYSLVDFLPTDIATFPVSSWYIQGVYDTDRSDGTEYDVIAIDFENSPPPLGLGLPQDARPRTYLQPSEIEEDSKIELANFRYIAKSFDLSLESYGQEVYESIRANPSTIKDRYKGLRFDQIGDFQDLVRTVRDSSQGVSAESFNADVFGSVTGGVAVCIGSELVELEDETCIERVRFRYDETEIARFVYIDESDATSVVDMTAVAAIDNQPDRRFLNTLEYRFEPATASSWATTNIRGLANSFFLKSRYMVVRDPVPENSPDLGKYFPVTYGYLHRVPMLQCISKKALDTDPQSAGDDYYVYSSHKCGVVTPENIKVEMFDPSRSDTTTQPIESRDFSLVMDDQIIKSPFPSVAKDHYKSQDDLFLYVGDLLNPYHGVETKKTLDGYNTYGIKLKGIDWDPKTGRFDKRYPIRNGVGSSPLYASFRGYLDKDGRVISHPIDIIRHFIKVYGRQPLSEFLIDDESADRVRNRTPKYRASVYLDSEIKISEFVGSICRQFGIFYSILDGVVYFSVPELSNPDLNKPLAEGYNLIEGMVEVQEGYSRTYSKIEYKYRYDYVAGNFQSTVLLSAANNKYCARAAKAHGNTKTLSVEAKWVRDSGVAREVAERMALFNSAVKKRYTCSADYTQDIIFKTGDVIQVTNREYHLQEQTAVVTKVKYRKTKMELEIEVFSD